MSWLELDDGILDHPKFIRAIKQGGSEVVHLWLGLRSYCGKLLTDGAIPVDMFDEIRGPTSKKRRVNALKALIDANLIEKKPDGSLVMHDYLHWSSSRDEVMQRRESSRIRQQRSRSGAVDIRSLSRRDSDETSALVAHPRARLPSDPLPLPLRSQSDADQSAPVPIQGRESEPRRTAHVAAITPHFLAVYDAYPNTHSKSRAAQEFQDMAPAYGGEEKFAERLLGLFKRGFLKRHPYNGEPRFVPTLAVVLAEKRFEEKWTTPSNGVPHEIPDLKPGVPRPPRVTP